MDEKKDEKDKKRRKEIMRIAGWKNKREVDMEDGEGVRGGRFHCLYFLVCMHRLHV